MGKYMKYYEDYKKQFATACRELTELLEKARGLSRRTASALAASAYSRVFRRVSRLAKERSASWKLWWSKHKSWHKETSTSERRRATSERKKAASANYKRDVSAFKASKHKKFANAHRQ